MGAPTDPTDPTDPAAPAAPTDPAARLRVLAGAEPVPAGDLLSLLPATGPLWVARLDGAAMADVAGVFAQFRQRLRLPDWFGGNWDALDDCLRDLAWLPADACLIVVAGAERVLAARPRERGILFEVLARAAGSRAPAVGVPVTVVLLCAPDHAGRLRAEIAGPPGAD